MSRESGPTALLWAIAVIGRDAPCADPLSGADSAKMARRATRQVVMDTVGGDDGEG